MSSVSHPIPRHPSAVAPEWTRGQVGMLCFLCSEAAFFSTLVVAYAIYIGKSVSGPTPGEALGLGLAAAGTFCLLSSSVTVHLATRVLRRGDQASFRVLWAVTIAFGILFLAATAWEWTGLIRQPPNGFGLTLGRNLFGTTYFTLVGFHAAHVTMGVIAMSVVLGLALGNEVSAARPEGAELISWYWHFVDGVWIVVFSVVYLFGR